MYHETLVAVYAVDPKSLESHSLMVMDMGQHVVQDLAQPLTLHQVMVPGLEDRAHAFPPLSTAQQLSPGVLLTDDHALGCCAPSNCALATCALACCAPTLLCPSQCCPSL